VEKLCISCVDFGNQSSVTVPMEMASEGSNVDGLEGGQFNERMMAGSSNAS